MAYRMRTFFQSLALASCISLLAACGGSDGGSTPETVNGVFIDSAVEGLRYVSGDLNGTTSTNGDFQCQSSVQFYVGDILLGEATCDEVITPVELVSGANDHTHPTVANIARFLQTLDDDDDPSNGITITTAVSNLAAGESIDFNSNFDTDSTVQSLVNTLTSARTAGAVNLVSAFTAQSHLQNSMFGLLAGTYEGSYSGDDSGTWTIVINNSGTVTGSTSDGKSISGSVVSNGSANFAAGTVGGSATFRGNFKFNGNANGTWQDGTERGTWNGRKSSSIVEEEPLDTGGCGSLSMTGDDIGTQLSNSFQPKLCAENASLSDSSISWIQASVRASLTLTLLDDGSPASLVYTVVTGPSSVYSYRINCSTRDCSNILRNQESNSINFTGLVMSRPNIVIGYANKVTAPITLNGTLSYTPASP